MDKLYNPRDCFGQYYFILVGSDIYRNASSNTDLTKCALSITDYELLCSTQGVNPIYPPFHTGSEVKKAWYKKNKEKIIEKIKEKRKEEKNEGNIYERIRKRRIELGHPVQDITKGSLT